MTKTSSPSQASSKLDAKLAEPPAGCSLCPRLVEYRTENQAAHPDWFNGAVPSFGNADAQFLIVGLAPGVTGANKTGRPFTGDAAGDLLYACLEKFGFSDGQYDCRPDDDLTLPNAMITNAVRCVPPQNKPIGEEINACRPHLYARIKTLKNLKIILTLGKIAHDSTIRAFGEKLSAFPFVHGAIHEIDSYKIIDSYHCSRYNTNTGRLTTEMFEAIFAQIKSEVDG